LAHSYSFGQNDFRACGTDEMVREAKKAYPGYSENLRQLEEFTREFIRNNPAQRTSGTVQYVIPVVFHVIHNYGPENISKAQIVDAVDIFNKSFQKLYADSVLIATPFKPLIADCQIEFRLAQRDPNGNCTDGITRTVSSLTYSAGDNVKALVAWPSNKYFNIWVVNNIASGAAGYAYYPGISSAIDGVVIRHDYTGSIGTSDGSNYAARSLVHEAGHWLNLPHTWGSTNNPGLAANCSDDDLVQDTPNTIGVANFSCDTSQVTCGSLDNVQNYMDYASCHYMFTNGQKARMHAALTSNIGQRNNLHSLINLFATGTNNGFVSAPCVPVAEFSSVKKYVCTGTSVTFTDLSWKADVTSWSWSFPGGTPSTSTDQNPVVQYNTPGVYDVTLTAYTSAGSNTRLRTGHVIVSSSPAATAAPFTEDFENISSIPSGADWIVENNAGNAWAVTTTAAYSGSKSLRLTNHSGNANGEIDVFITPGYNFTNITNASMKFKLAYAARSSTSTDQLKVLASSTCGELWALRYTESGLNLATAGIISSSFVPTNATQWREETVNLNSVSYNNKPSVRFKFQYTQNTGNNIFIDDINVTGTSTVGIQDVEFLSTLNIHPNPSVGVSSIRFQLQKDAEVRIVLSDLSGRTVESIADGRLSGGAHTMEFGQGLPSGVYLLRLMVDGGTLTEKVVFTK
ncbi:MAG: M43 family zinc metalloprotease, partial [Bacteroidota bacterium]